MSTRVSDAGLAHLKGLTDLVALELADTRVSDDGLVHLKGLTKLKGLQLPGTRVSDASLKSFTSLPSLSHLGLVSTRVSARGFADLKAALPKVQVTWSEPNRTVAEAVLALGGTVHLRPDGEGERLVRAVADLPAQHFRVTQVHAPGTGKPLGDLSPSLGRLSDPTFDDLRVLDLTGTAATDADLGKNLAKLTKLTDLSLARTQISDDGLASLVALKRLRRLVLDGTAVRAPGLRRLKELPELVELRLGCPTLIDLGITPLGELKRLRKLSLVGSQVSDEGLKALADLKELQELDLTGTKVTPQGLAALKKALPRCKLLSGPVPK
jgi:Leucine-rich repeat (LRR) protein